MASSAKECFFSLFSFFNIFFALKFKIIFSSHPSRNGNLNKLPHKCTFVHYRGWCKQQGRIFLYFERDAEAAPILQYNSLLQRLSASSSFVCRFVSQPKRIHMPSPCFSPCPDFSKGKGTEAGIPLALFSKTQRELVTVRHMT